MSVTFACPKGHQSDDPDFCSVCGIKLDRTVDPVAVDPSVERCPACGIQRIAGARFCETCRYDFKAPPATASASGGSLLVPDTAASDRVAPGPGAAAGESEMVADVFAATRAPAAAAARYWEAIVSVDCSLDVEPDAEAPCPVGTPERSFPLDLAENLIGRRSAARGIQPSIALNDPGVSHRHLMVYRNQDGSLVVSDVGSTNGTFLNASTDRLEPGVKTPVGDGDNIELGRWTRITFHCRS